MVPTYTLPIGAFVHCNLPHAGYGIVVEIEKELDSEGKTHEITHILWNDLKWTAAEDLRIPVRDHFWTVVLSRVPETTLCAAKANWRRVVKLSEKSPNEKLLEQLFPPTVPAHARRWFH